MRNIGLILLLWVVGDIVFYFGLLVASGVGGTSGLVPGACRIMLSALWPLTLLYGAAYWIGANLEAALREREHRL